MSADARTIAKLQEQIDAAANQPHQIAAIAKQPPTYGSPQRDAINSVVDNIVGDLCGKIGELRKTLDAIEQQVLESAAGAKHALQDHILVCIRVNDEISHMKGVIEDIKQAAKYHERN
jgi:hypothetical protein